VVNVVVVVQHAVAIIAPLVVLPNVRLDCILVQLDVEVELLLADLLEHVVEPVKVLASELPLVVRLPSTNLINEQVEQLDGNEVQLALKGAGILPFPAKLVLSIVARNFIASPVIRVGRKITLNVVSLVFAIVGYDDK